MMSSRSAPDSVKSCTVMLAAGGTGGHLFPALALAEELRRRGCRTVLMADRRIRQFHDCQGADAVHIIAAATFSGGWRRRILAALQLMLGMLQSWRLLRRYRPDCVVGFGGYPAFPTMFAASFCGFPTIIHEQNAILGRANRVLAPRVDRLALSFEHTGGVAAAEMARQAVTVTGNPVRMAIQAVRDAAYTPLTADGPLRLLVLGGSLGASVFARVVPDAIRLLPENQRRRLRVEQQCRAEHLAATRARYEALGVEATLSAFFHDVDMRLARAQLVISRAGASSVAELLVAARPSILVPLPEAMDDHQSINANVMQETGCGWVMPEEGFTPEALAVRLEGFLTLPSSLNQLAERSRRSMPPNAAKKLADTVEAVIKERRKHGEE